jgi:hypothetical protein
MPRIDDAAYSEVSRTRANTRDRPGRNFACRCDTRRSCCAAVATLGLRHRVVGAGGLVLFLSLGSEPLRARTASWALGSVEKRGDPRLTPRARCPAAPVRPSADRAGRSCTASHAQPGASTPSVASLLGPPGDVAAVAPAARVAALDVSTQEAGTATSRTTAAGADPTSRPREPASGLSTDRRRAQAARPCGLSDHGPQGAEPR